MTQEEIEVKNKVLEKVGIAYDEIMEIVNSGDEDKIFGYTMKVAAKAAREDIDALLKLALMNVVQEEL